MVQPLHGEVPRTGAIVGQLFGRRVYRVLCCDGDDLILRNVRNGSLIVALPQSEVAEEFGLVESVGGSRIQQRFTSPKPSPSLQF